MTKVKDILALAAANLGRDDLATEVYDVTGEPTGEVASLLRCYNLIENEVALDYYPLKTQEEFDFLEELPYTLFRYAPVSVSEVKVDGIPVTFELLFSSLKLSRAEGSRVLVTYSYTPAGKNLESTPEYAGRISARLISFGVASEFCLTTGRYAEAAAWEKKYRDALKAANILRKRLAMRSRRWA